MDEVLSLLDRQGIVWKAKEDDRTVKNGENRPPFWFYGIELSDFRSLGEVEKLALEFFNNRLLSTTFYPDSLDTFKEKASGRVGSEAGR